MHARMNFVLVSLLSLLVLYNFAGLQYSIKTKGLAHSKQKTKDFNEPKMKILAFLGIVIFFATTFSQYGHAQIPRACTDEASLRDLTCCPTTSNGVCGAVAGRGACMDLQLPHSNTTTDVRRNWPHYFTRACQCTGNFSGYDCSR